MKDYIVYLSTGEILETPEAVDSHVLYDAVRLRMREMLDESYFKAAFGDHANWYPWQIAAVCFLKDGEHKRFVWAFHGDVFFGYDFYAKYSEPLKHFISETFKREEYYKKLGFGFFMGELT